MKRVVVVGGGISGLAAAHRLCALRRERNQALDITLLEARERLGGVIETTARDGFLLEAGPDAFLIEKPWALDLCRELGLEGELLETSRSLRRSFVLKSGRLVPVPRGFYLMAPDRLTALVGSPLLTWKGKLRMACDLFLPPRRGREDETVGSFVRRRLGSEALERLAQPMIAGIYTADADRLSLTATFPRFQEMEAEFGSVIRGIRSRVRREASASGPRYGLFLTLRGGMGRLVEALGRALPDVAVRCSARVASLARQGRWRVKLTDGSALDADAVCVALPAPSAASLLASGAPDLAGLLAAIPYESVATVNMAFRASGVARPLDGFGFVVPRSEGKRLVGCSFSSTKFPGRAPEGHVLVRAFLGGALDRTVLEAGDGDLERIVREELAETLGIQEEPTLAQVARFPQAMPQYPVRHLARVAEIERRLTAYEGLRLTGNGYRGIGIPDCIEGARSAAEKISDGF